MSKKKGLALTKGDRPQILTSLPLHPEQVISHADTARELGFSLYSPHKTGATNALDTSEQQACELAVSADNTAPCMPSSKDDSVSIHTGSGTQSRQLRCSTDDCTFKGVFPRKWELDRHIEAKHRVRAGGYVCYVEGCINKQLQLP